MRGCAQNQMKQKEQTHIQTTTMEEASGQGLPVARLVHLGLSRPRPRRTRKPSSPSVLSSLFDDDQISAFFPKVTDSTTTTTTAAESTPFDLPPHQPVDSPDLTDLDGRKGGGESESVRQCEIKTDAAHNGHESDDVTALSNVTTSSGEGVMGLTMLLEGRLFNHPRPTSPLTIHKPCPTNSRSYSDSSSPTGDRFLSLEPSSCPQSASSTDGSTRNRFNFPPKYKVLPDIGLRSKSDTCINQSSDGHNVLDVPDVKCRKDPERDFHTVYNSSDGGTLGKEVLVNNDVFYRDSGIDKQTTREVDEVKTANRRGLVSVTESEGSECKSPSGVVVTVECNKRRGHVNAPYPEEHGEDREVAREILEATKAENGSEGGTLPAAVSNRANRVKRRPPAKPPRNRTRNNAQKGGQTTPSPEIQTLGINPNREKIFDIMEGNESASAGPPCDTDGQKETSLLPSPPPSSSPPPPLPPRGLTKTNTFPVDDLGDSRTPKDNCDIQGSVNETPEEHKARLRLPERLRRPHEKGETGSSSGRGHGAGENNLQPRAGLRPRGPSPSKPPRRDVIATYSLEKDQEQCPEHGATLNFYCTKCRVVVCRDCTVVTHSQSDDHRVLDTPDSLTTLRTEAVTLLRHYTLLEDMHATLTDIHNKFSLQFPAQETTAMAQRLEEGRFLREVMEEAEKVVAFGRNLRHIRERVKYWESRQHDWGDLVFLATRCSLLANMHVLTDKVFLRMGDWVIPTPWIHLCHLLQPYLEKNQSSSSSSSPSQKNSIHVPSPFFSLPVGGSPRSVRASSGPTDMPFPYNARQVVLSSLIPYIILNPDIRYFIRIGGPRDVDVMLVVAPAEEHAQDYTKRRRDNATKSPEGLRQGAFRPAQDSITLVERQMMMGGTTKTRIVASSMSVGDAGVPTTVKVSFPDVKVVFEGHGLLAAKGGVNKGDVIVDYDSAGRPTITVVLQDIGDFPSHRLGRVTRGMDGLLCLVGAEDIRKAENSGFRAKIKASVRREEEVIYDITFGMDL